MALTTLDGFIAQVGAGNSLQQPIWGNYPATSGGPWFSTQKSTLDMVRRGSTKLLPSPLPAGITNYIITQFHAVSSAVGELLLAKLINFGTFDIGANSFTDGSTMPTKTEAGVSRVSDSPIIAEVTTALSFSSTCTLTCTYTNQAGTISQSTPAVSLLNGCTNQSAGYFALASGDSGCRDITAVTRGGTPGSPSGVIQFWGIVPICLVGQSVAFIGVGENLLTGAFHPARLGAGDQLGVFGFGNNTAGALSGNLFIVGDN